MRVWRQLRRIDARYTKWRYRNYDETPPLWIEFGSMIGAAAAVTLGVAARSGGAWWVLAALTGALLITYLIAARRWVRYHKKRPRDEFEIAVDRQ